MCGFAGMRRLDPRPVEARTLQRMIEPLAHRGPDGQGIWISPDSSVGLGHRRLSIIDLAGSHQPMSSPDGRYHLVFNGEIFNYATLRRAIDYPFSSNGDTEVLLAGLIRDGADFLPQLRGQFAFALFDTVTGSLMLGRDRAGVLPLFYHQTPEAVVFGSEIKALLPTIADLRVDLDSLDGFLTHNSVHAPNTLFSGVRKVRPGHTVTFTAHGAATEASFWELPPASEVLALSPRQAVAAVGGTLENAVRAALVADVPVGSYLSGGVDSSLIVAMMRRIEPEARIETFAAGFGDPRYDELPFARAVAEQLGTNHHEVAVNAADFVELWPTLTWYRDAPLSQPADIAVHRLAQAARAQVKVVLSGEGSDELFAGYRKYRYARLASAGDWVPGDLAQRAAGFLAPRLPSRLGAAGVPVRAASQAPGTARADSWFAPFGPQARADLLGRPITAGAGVGPGSDVIRQMLVHDFGGWLPDNLLERGDRMTMAASLELRPPFLDPQMIELAFRLPSSVKVRHTHPKWVVKAVASQHLPPQIVSRPKVGFRVPLDAWLRGGLADQAHDLLTGPESFANQVFDPAQVSALLARHQSGRANEENRIWTLLSLEVWHRRYFPRPGSGPTV